MAVLFHRLLAPAAKVAADLLVLFVTVRVPIALAAFGDRMDLIALLDERAPDLITQAPRLLRSEANLFEVATVFWGL